MEEARILPRPTTKEDDLEEGEEEEEEKEQPWQKQRETWDGQMDFLIACVGCSVGLGNVWRFPYLCYKHGGGAFLLAYYTSLLIGGFPLFFMELAVGQYMGQSGLRAWSIVPLFQGIGLATVVMIFLISCYYEVILAWTLYYIFCSFSSTLPWESCGHEWNSPSCSDDFITIPSNTSIANITRNIGNISSVTNNTDILTNNDNNITSASIMTLVDPVTEFWENNVLHISHGLDEPGTLRWNLVVCLLLTWIIVFICICKGIKSSGKVMYVTATAPYLFMFILLIRNCTLDGAGDGVKFYLKPNMSKLAEPPVWVDAGTQIFFSWGIGVGVVTVLGSYNKFHHDSLKDSVIFSIINGLTSLLAGFIVFSILGFMAKHQHVSVSAVAESGPGLAFIAYPKAVVQLPFSPVWSIVFFLMVMLLGLDGQFMNVEAVISSIVDQYPHVLRRGYRKEIFVGCLCLAMFLVGLSMVTEGGMYVFQIFDYYSGSRVIILVALCELIAISYCYGSRRFIDNVRMMMGDSPMIRHLNVYLHVTLCVSVPVFCVVIFVLIMYDYSDLTYQRPHHPEYIYPSWGVGIGFAMALVSIVWVPVVAIVKVTRLALRGGLLTAEDLCVLIVPYSLEEHQRRPQDKHERCLADIEKTQRFDYQNLND